jgi:hypothetical protein
MPDLPQERLHTLGDGGVGPRVARMLWVTGLTVIYLPSPTLLPANEDASSYGSKQIIFCE